MIAPMIIVGFTCSLKNNAPHIIPHTIVTALFKKAVVNVSLVVTEALSYLVLSAKNLLIISLPNINYYIFTYLYYNRVFKWY